MSDCLLLRLWHIKFSATCQKCQNSVVFCDRILNSLISDFYRCTSHGFAVVASSTVIVFVFFCQWFCALFDNFLLYFKWSWAEQQFIMNMFLKVLCVVISYSQCITVALYYNFDHGSFRQFKYHVWWSAQYLNVLLNI